MGNWGREVKYQTEDPDSSGNYTENSISIKYSSVSDAGSLIFKDNFRNENQEIALSEDGFQALIEILNGLRTYSKFG